MFPVFSAYRVVISVFFLIHAHIASAENIRLNICYNFGCKEQSTVLISDDDLALVEEIFQSADSAEDEKSRIRRGIAMMERISGNQLPTSNDVGGNYQQGMMENGQMDCIDESTNTTTYLMLFQQLGLLHWHKVEERAFRAPYLLDQHWAAQISERDGGRHYAVDSWLKDNGEPPLIQPLEDWKNKRPVPDDE